MLTALIILPSTVPRLFVLLDAQAVNQFVKAAEQVDHSHQLEYGLVVQPQLLHRRSVDPESIVAPIHR